MSFNNEVKLFVKNLPWSCDEDVLYNTFAEHGEVTFTRLCTDQESGRSRGFGFVSFNAKENADKALAALDGYNMDGRQIVVKLAEQRERGQTNQRRPQGVCFAFQKGQCTRGDSCKFSHDADAAAAPARPRGVCFAFQKGQCTRGDSCKFAHEGAADEAPKQEESANKKTTFDSDNEEEAKDEVAAEPEAEEEDAKKKAKKDKKSKKRKAEEEETAATEDAEEESPKKAKKAKKEKKAKKSKAEA